MARNETARIRLVIDGKEIKNTVGELEREARKLQKVLKNLEPEAEGYDKIVADLGKVQARLNQVKKATDESVKEARKLEGEMEDVAQETTDAAKAAKQLKDRLEDGEKAAGGFGSAFGRAGELIKGALAATGILALIDQVIAFAQGFGQVALEAQKARSQVQRLTGETGPELDKLTAQVVAFAQRTGKEVPEVLEAANALINKFGLTGQQAMQKLNQASNLAVDTNDELLEVISEYAPLIAEAGIGVDEFLAVLINSERQGAFSLDKVADFYKEFGIRIREQTKATSDALAPLGETFRADLFKGLNDGTITVNEALQRVVTRLEETGLKGAQLQTVIADVFGAQGEDLGVNFILGLNDANQSFGQLLETQDEYAKGQEMLNQFLERFNRTVLVVTEGVKKFALEFIARSAPIREAFAPVVDLVVELYEQVRTLITTVFGLEDAGSAAQFLADTIAKALTLILTPIKLVLEALGLITKAFNFLYKEFSLFRGLVGGFTELVVAAFLNIRQSAADILGGVGDIVLGIFTLDKDRLLKGIQSATSGLGNVTVKQGKVLADAFTRGFQDGLNKEVKTPEVVAKSASVQTTVQTTTQTTKENNDKNKVETLTQAQIDENKKRTDQLTQQRKDAEKKASEELAKLTEEKTLRELKDEQARQEQKLKFEFERKKKEVENTLATEEQKTAIVKLLQEELDTELRKIEEDRQKKVIELAQQSELAKRETNLIEAETRLSATDETDPDEQLAALQSVFDAKMALLEQQKEIELALLEENEAEAAKVRAEFAQAELAAEQEFADKKLEIETNTNEAKKRLQADAVGASFELLGATAALIGEDEKLQKKFGATLKRVKQAEVAINLQSEIQAIWANANANPSNALFPGFAQIIAGAKTAAAVIRAGVAVAKIQKETFAGGGELQGPSHAQGGIPVALRGSSSRIEAEGGEYFVRRAATRRNRAALRTINALGDRFTFDVTPIMKYAAGGELPLGVPDPTPLAQRNLSAPDNSALVAEFASFREEVANWQNNFQVNLIYTDLEEVAGKVATVRSA